MVTFVITQEEVTSNYTNVEEDIRAKKTARDKLDNIIWTAEKFSQKIQSHHVFWKISRNYLRFKELEKVTCQSSSLVSSLSLSNLFTTVTPELSQEPSTFSPSVVHINFFSLQLCPQTCVSKPIKVSDEQRDLPSKSPTFQDPLVMFSIGHWSQTTHLSAHFFIHKMETV